MERPMSRYALPENQLPGFLERIARHKPDRVTVVSVPMPEQLPGTTAFQIVGTTADDVQREIDKIMVDVDVRGGVSEFRNPERCREHQYFGRFISRGYTRVSPPAMEAAE
jgi:hypothetical protein